jgi:hypothetical protein
MQKDKASVGVGQNPIPKNKAGSNAGLVLSTPAVASVEDRRQRRGAVDDELAGIALPLSQVTYQQKVDQGKCADLDMIGEFRRPEPW